MALRILIVTLITILGTPRGASAVLVRPLTSVAEASGISTCVYDHAVNVPGPAVRAADTGDRMSGSCRSPRTSPPNDHRLGATRGATTTLYRAVGPAELAQIQKTGTLVNLGSAEGKYFTTQAEAASQYARQAVKGFGDAPYTMVSTQVPTSAITPAMQATVDRGVPAVVVPNSMLPGLVPQVHTSMPIPPGPWR